MEAKETVVGLERLVAMAKDLKILALGVGTDDIVKGLREHLLAQAEITGKIMKQEGRKEVVGWMRQERERHAGQHLGKPFEEVLIHYFQHKDISLNK